MKKNAKTVLGIILLCVFIFALNACQEDVYPDSQLDSTQVEIQKDQKSDTDDQGKDEGVEPR